MSSRFRGRNLLASFGAFVLLLLLVCVTAAPQQVSATAPVSGPSFTVTSTGGHFQTASSSSDTSGTLAITMGNATAAHTFSTPYSPNAPVCAVTPLANITTVTTTWWTTTTVTTVTVHASPAVTGNLAFSYICVGNPT